LRKGRILALLLGLMIVSATRAFAGNIPGDLKNPRGFSQSHIYTSVCIAGESQYPPPNCTATGTTGIFYFPNMPAGTYSQGFSEKESFEVLYRKNIVVPATGDSTYVSLQYNPATFNGGNLWSDPWHSSFSQSFVATGENVVSVGLRDASNGGEIAVQILDGDNPNASQIGPTRVLGISSTNGQCAYWSAGEVPTVPGQTYTVKFTRSGGGQISPWRQTILTQMRSDNPDGQTWEDGVLDRRPLEMTVNMDDAGLINTMCCGKHKTGIPIPTNTHAGQTFTAKGNCVLLVTWLTGSYDKWAISVHDGAGSGSGGPQIGPTKWVYGVAWDGRAVVTWLPGEVPTTPGHTYYVKIRPPLDVTTVIYNAWFYDEYAGGTAYVNGSVQPFDFAMGIYEQKYTGSLDEPTVQMYNMRVESITDSSAVVKWTTSPGADSLVEYGEITPYTDSDYSSTVLSSHEIALTGLHPNTMYHVRAKSNASGYKTGQTRDMVFCTAAAGPNLLADPGFESGAFGSWVGQGSTRFVPPNWFADAGPRTGNWGIGGAGNGVSVNGTAYQRVAAFPGEEYKLTGWLWTYCSGGNFASHDHQTKVRIGIDPTGGTDPNSGDIIWTPYSNSQEVWTQFGLKAIATSNYITVFFYGGIDIACDWTIWVFDDFYLTQEAEAVETTIDHAVSDMADGAFVKFTDVYCTASPGHIGDYYIETEDRISGIRVETENTMSLADRATVIGTMNTDASGERYLDDAVVQTRVFGGVLKPLACRMAGMGGASPGPHCAGVPGTYGPYNVGVLVRCAGEVTAAGTGYIFVNDGSLPGYGVKVDTSKMSTPPGVGDIVGATGILQLEGVAPSPTVFVRPRGSSEVRTYLNVP